MQAISNDYQNALGGDIDFESQYAGGFRLQLSIGCLVCKFALQSAICEDLTVLRAENGL